MSSGWHLQQSQVERDTGRNAFASGAPAEGSNPADALHTLSEAGTHWLAGLLAHARGMTPLCTPTVNGFAQFHPNALAPQNILWGDALTALKADARLVAGLGEAVVQHFCRIKQSELDRHTDAKDKTDCERREYFSRY